MPDHRRADVEYDRTAEEEPAERAPIHEPPIAPAGLEPRTMRPADVLSLQRRVGNHAVADMLGRASQPAPASAAAATGGLMPGVESKAGEGEKQVVGGQTVDRTLGETVGDIARPIGVGLGNLVGSAAGALAGGSIGTANVVAPTWDPNGSFTWDVGFTTSGASGWIVQEVVNTYRAEDNTGASVVPPHTPHYWEAWAVDATSAVSPSAGAINDMWRRPDLGVSKGHWSMRGKCHFTTTDPATQGFAAGNAPDAGILLSSTSEPAGLGIARLHRYAQGTWDSTGAAPTHTGSAGP